MQRAGRDFRTFYYTKVGLGEGCGFAERVIDLHEADRKAATPLTRPLGRRPTLAQRWHRVMAALGLARRR